MVIRDVGPRCKAPGDKKNGQSHSGKQTHQGEDCGHQGVQGFAQSLSAEEKRGLSERWLVERLAWRGMGRAGGRAHASGSWGFLSSALRSCRIIGLADPSPGSTMG
jgi:hypothetical protein